MLKVVIPPVEYWDYRREVFSVIPGMTIEIEYSLAAISEWETIWEKPLLNSEHMKPEEFQDFVRCMTLTPNVDPRVYKNLSPDNIKAINDYMAKKMTATTFRDQKKPTGAKQIITAEIIYYWMVELGIPFECDKWHFNKLMTLIRVCGEKQAVPKKMSKKELFSRNTSLNAARRAAMHSRG